MPVLLVDTSDVMPISASTQPFTRAHNTTDPCNPHRLLLPGIAEFRQSVDDAGVIGAGVKSCVTA